MAKLTLQVLVWSALLGALVMGPAGTWAYPGAWALVGLFAGGGLAITGWLHRNSPGLLTERMRGPVRKDQKAWDRVLLAIFLASFCGWLMFMGWDAARAGFAAVPIGLQAVGGVGVAAYMLVAWWTFRENAFAATVVKIQVGQRVIDTGPYAVVRHPMYSGLLMFFLGVPLLLGSWWGLVGGALFILGVAYRSTREEDALSAELAGYDAYLGRVRYRLVPYIF